MGANQEALIFWSLGWLAMTVHMIQRWYEQVVVSTSYSYIIPHALIIPIASMYMEVKNNAIHGWYCWWTKSCTTKDDDYPMIYRVLSIPGGAGFLPSTVWLIWDWSNYMAPSIFTCSSQSRIFGSSAFSSERKRKRFQESSWKGSAPPGGRH